MQRYLRLVLFVLMANGLDIHYLVAQSNEGKEFYFSFMQHIDQGQNSMVALISSRTSTRGVISAPSANFSSVFSTTPGETTIINLPKAAETIGSERIQNNGLRIISEEPISVYIHQYSGMRSEASLVLPIESLGNAYYVMSYEGITGFNSSEVFPSEFLIVGTKDDSSVEITLSDDTEGGRRAGMKYSININAGQTYQVRARAASDDLTGTYIVSDKPVAVFGGNAWTSVPTSCNFRDNLLEQMYAVGTWGKQYVAAPSAHLAFNVYRVIAAEDNTSVEILSSSARTISLNQGNFNEFELRGEGAYIRSNKPILVAQYIPGESCNGRGNGDPSMLLLNSIEQYRDTVTLYNSSFENITENFINAVIKTEDTAITFLDGQVLKSTAIFSGTLGPDNEFTYLTAKVNTGAHNLISLGCGVIASAYGYGPIESYAYGGGASFSQVNSNPIPEGGCLNDTVFFDAGLNPFQHELFWDLGDGTFSTEASFQHFYRELGFYPVTLMIYNKCLDIRDTLYRDLEISLRQAVSAVPDTLVCEGTSLFLGATDVDRATYQWLGPDDFYSEEQYPIYDLIPASASGVYEVIGIISGCATFPVYTTVEVIPTPDPEFNQDTFFCSRDHEVILEVGDFIAYSWPDGSTGPSFTTAQEGLYKVYVTDEYDCVGTDSIQIYDRCPTQIFVPNAFSPNQDGINDRLEIFGNDINDFHLTIFDRWGNVVFESASQSDHWDGNFALTPAPAGVYTWRLDYAGIAANRQIKDYRKFGTITLIR